MPRFLPPVILLRDHGLQQLPCHCFIPAISYHLYDGFSKIRPIVQSPFYLHPLGILSWLLFIAYLIVLIWFRPIPRDTQELYLALWLGSTPGRLRGPSGILGFDLWLATFKETRYSPLYCGSCPQFTVLFSLFQDFVLLGTICPFALFLFTPQISI